MSYTREDYAESLEGVGIDPSSVKHVHAAWGQTGDYAEWLGGFLIELRDGRFAYIEGSCDTSGWGCQDQAEVRYYDARPDPVSIRTIFLTPDEATGDVWDDDPADLNLWHARGCPVG